MFPIPSLDLEVNLDMADSYLDLFMQLDSESIEASAALTVDDFFMNCACAFEIAN